MDKTEWEERRQKTFAAFTRRVENHYQRLIEKAATKIVNEEVAYVHRLMAKYSHLLTGDTLDQETWIIEFTNFEKELVEWYTKFILDVRRAFYPSISGLMDVAATNAKAYVTDQLESDKEIESNERFQIEYISTLSIRHVTSSTRQILKLLKGDKWTPPLAMPIWTEVLKEYHA